MQAFIDGAQLSGGAMELLATALRDIFAADSYVTDRVGQVNYLWRRLNGGVPLIKPAAGHAVFVDVKAFLPHLSAAQFPAEALAAFIYHMSGIRLTKGPPPAPGKPRAASNCYAWRSRRAIFASTFGRCRRGDPLRLRKPRRNSRI